MCCLAVKPLELELLSSFDCQTKTLLPRFVSNPVWCLLCRQPSMPAKRIDPATGKVVTYRELLSTYQTQYTKEEIQDRH